MNPPEAHAGVRVYTRVRWGVARRVHTLNRQGAQFFTSGSNSQMSAPKRFVSSLDVS